MFVCSFFVFCLNRQNIPMANMRFLSLKIHDSKCKRFRERQDIYDIIYGIMASPTPMPNCNMLSILLHELLKCLKPGRGLQLGVLRSTSPFVGLFHSMSQENEGASVIPRRFRRWFMRSWTAWKVSWKSKSVSSRRLVALASSDRVIERLFSVQPSTNIVIWYFR